MSVRMRHTRSHTKNRRSHHALKDVRLSKCSNCNEPHRRHQVCANCGNYRGKQVVDVAAKIAKKAEKQKARAQAVKEAEKETKGSTDNLDPTKLSEK